MVKESEKEKSAKRLSLKRTPRIPSPDEERDSEPRPAGVSAGPIDKVIELAFNPTREKIREVTIVDRMQGRLFPQLDMVNAGIRYILEIALYRQDRGAYRIAFKKPRPVSPDLLDEFLFRTAQWQKSVAGKNLERATDIALAETEIKAGEEEDSIAADAWRE